MNSCRFVDLSRSEIEERDTDGKYSWPAAALIEVFIRSRAEDREYLRGRYEDEIRMGLVSFFVFDLVELL